MLDGAFGSTTLARGPHDQHADILRRSSLDRTPGRSKDATVDRQQIGSLHALLAGHTADTQHPVGATESILQVITVRFFDTGQSGKGTILQFHLDTVEGRQHGRNLDQLQDHRLVGPEHLATGNSKDQGIADISGGTGHGHSNRIGHWDFLAASRFRE